MIGKYFEENFPQFVEKLVVFIDSNESFFYLIFYKIPNFVESHLLMFYFLALTASIGFSVWLFFKQKEMAVRFTKWKIFFFISIVPVLYLLGFGVVLISLQFTGFGF